jgi:hypothetical protein
MRLPTTSVQLRRNPLLTTAINGLKSKCSMPQDVPPLTAAQRAQVTEALSLWAENHPYRDLPIIQLADGSELTPRDMAIAASEPESQRGRLLYRVFATALIPDEVESAETLEEILIDYRRDIEFWRTAGLERR